MAIRGIDTEQNPSYFHSSNRDTWGGIIQLKGFYNVCNNFR